MTKHTFLFSETDRNHYQKLIEDEQTLLELYQRLLQHTTDEYERKDTQNFINGRIDMIAHYTMLRDKLAPERLKTEDKWGDYMFEDDYIQSGY